MESTQPDHSTDNNKNQADQQAAETSGPLAKKMETMEQPNVDRRVTTEDVQGTKGFTFKSFGLSDEIQFVSRILISDKDEQILSEDAFSKNLTTSRCVYPFVEIN